MKSKKMWLSLMLVLVVAIMSACGSSGDGTSSSSNTAENTATTDDGQPKDGGSIIIAVQDDPKVMNPIYAGDRVTLTIDQSLYAPLFNVNDGKKTYVLAESDSFSDDHLTYTLKLKDGLKWHDGQPLTADDIVFTMDSILDEKQHSSSRSQYVFDGKPVKVTKVDDLTVEFKLPEVSAAFEGALVSFSPIPKHIFEGEADIEKSDKNNNPIGSGPFKFKEYRPGEYVTLERFDDYFAGKAHLDSVTYRVAKDPNAANLALQNGEIQMRMVDTQDYNKLNDTGKFNMLTYPEGRLQYMVFNLNVPSMQKKEVRQAIAYALDKNELITASYSSADFAEPAPSILTPDTLYQTDDVEKYDYNVEKAKQLLADAGVSNLKLRLAYTNTNKPQTSQALYIQQKLKDVGIEVELLPMDGTAYGNRTLDMNNTDFELSFGGYIMGYEPDAYKSLFLSDAAYNYSHYKNADFDKLWNEAAVQIDETKRGDLYKQIQQTVANEMTVYPIAYTNAVVAVDNTYGGVEDANPKPVVMLEDLSKIYKK
ncbi:MULTISPECIES: ABC transporter substrate-binding protein [unclassified Paenibacillus]|uniref:ABC transporter substrate-binding protein n=1 Tax=unclassified Paenibacillus TaxID=185978 RepID=UPI0009A90B88|nr:MULTISPECIES: ABC transporter substrate-binding protein [unclassified Paenibacillus]SLK04127.1 peptide/nickel transport system substrate-binding protein [Paenibacillus sp. RU5A]SOC69552.1 peptide/nickel transport system substrate-binding protein [Paenibacillus sp. RU26A]SOC71997.1 peptide/nickel transport system substrate-binding protein [Paenibacillus sp. RU5M]